VFYSPSEPTELGTPVFFCHIFLGTASGQFLRPAVSRAQSSRRVPQFLKDALPKRPAPGVAGFFLEYGGIAKGAHRGMASLFAAHPCVDVLGDLLFEMKLKLVIESVGSPLAKE
jgi:hypothetical protein